MKRCLLALTLSLTACAQTSQTASRPDAPPLPSSSPESIAATNTPKDDSVLPLDQTLPLMDAARPVLFPPDAARARDASKGQTPPPATFQPSAERIVPRLFAASLPPDSRAKREVEFAGYIQSYEDRITKRGARPNDLARAAGFFIAATYYAASGGTELSQPQADALRLNLESAVPSSAAFGGASAADKQRLYETFVVLGQFFAANYDQSDARAKQQLRDLARQHLGRLTGVPYEGIRFTDKGIEF